MWPWNAGEDQYRGIDEQRETQCDGGIDRREPDRLAASFKRLRE